MRPTRLFHGVGMFKGMIMDHSITKSKVTPGTIWIYQTDFVSCKSEIENQVLKKFVCPTRLVHGIGVFKGMVKDHSITKSKVTPGKIQIYQTVFVSCNSEIENHVLKKFVHPTRLVHGVRVFKGIA